jgi:AbrB family looped-hinge helix DNA binding protein
MAVLVSKLTSKGQTTIPEPARDALPIKPGQRLGWEINDGFLIVRPLRDLRELAGCLKGGKPSASTEQMNQAVKDARTKHLLRKYGRA